jgi:DNA polymerase-3 subunit gamma/tau
VDNRHIVLSRKYRPKDFSELQGQDALVKTLTNAITHNKLAQTYLLTGIRGVGKTTTARIIAKTINCTDLQIENHIPKPCNICNNCLNIKNSSHPDIIEIDAASRTGVDDIRIIIDNAEYKPLMGKYKVFIIDEIHMLSKNAFNALLKLLEEPPSHCLFIFATTEVHKIPLTIISRCQRFDLLRFSNSDLEDFLRKIASKENIKINDEAIKILATKSDGSARDGLSLLDQALLSSNNSDDIISSELVERMLCAVDHKIILKFLSSIIDSDPKLALKTLQEFYQSNTNFDIFISEFLSILAFIAKKLMVKDYHSDEFFSIHNNLDKITEKTDITFIQIAWQISYKAEMELKFSSNSLELMEMLALKLIYVINHKQSEQIPRQSLEKISQKPQEKNPDLSFESFLRFLSNNKDFNILFDLLNKTELASINNNIFLISSNSADSNFEKSLSLKIKEWSNSIIDVKFSYKDSIVPYKDNIKNKFIAEATFKKILKNFSEVEIVDIVVDGNRIN